MSKEHKCKGKEVLSCETCMKSVIQAANEDQRKVIEKAKRIKVAKSFGDVFRALEPHDNNEATKKECPMKNEPAECRVCDNEEVTKNESGGYKEPKTIEEEFHKEFPYLLKDERDNRMKYKIISFIKEVQQKEREKMLESLKKIDSEAWQDAVHCTCLGYAISMINNDYEYHPKDYKCNEIKND